MVVLFRYTCARLSDKNIEVADNVESIVNTVLSHVVRLLGALNILNMEAILLLYVYTVDIMLTVIAS